MLVQDVPPSELSARLVAAKPITWRGRGDLVQVTWTPVLRGSWLVLDLWSGVGGLCIALLQMGMHFYGLSAEMDAQARAVASSNMPALVHCDRVETLRAADLVPFLRRRRVRGILLGGGSPCQGNSILNKRRLGLDDERSCQPLLLVELRAEIEALPEAEGLEILSLLENVQSMPKEVCSQYSSWLGGDPVAIRSGSCGWVVRNRLYWLVSRRKSVSSGMAPPDDWEWEDGVTPPVLSFCGKKPLPPKVHFQQGFQPLLSPTEVVAKKGQGAMHTFTREFYHPSDRVRDVPPEITKTFFEDNRRFPPGSYSDSSLVWKGNSWRTLTPEERGQIMVGYGRNLTRIYSDASFENGELRLGWVIFPPSGRAEGGTCVVPPPVLASWKERTQQIFPGESLAGLVVPLLHPKLFYQAECLWFIDNEAAVAALIRGSTREADVHL